MIDLLLLVCCALQGAAPAPTPVVPQDGERPSLSATDLKALRDTNIFAPHAGKTSARKTPRTPDREPRVSTPAKPKPPLVTGIFFDARSGAQQVIVEDRNEEKLRQFTGPKFLKVGDEIAGLKVESIAETGVAFRKGDAVKTLKVGDPLPEGDFKGAAAAVADESDPEAEPSLTGTKPESKPLEPAVRTETLESLRKKNRKNRPSPEE